MLLRKNMSTMLPPCILFCWPGELVSVLTLDGKSVMVSSCLAGGKFQREQKSPQGENSLLEFTPVTAAPVLVKFPRCLESRESEGSPGAQSSGSDTSLH